MSSRRRHTRWPRDWSSDVCSSDLTGMYEVDGEYEITHDKKGNEVRTKISNLGDDVGIDFNHHLDGDRKGQTEIVNTKNGVTNWIADSRFIRGYEKRDNSANWNTIYREWQDGKGPENSLFFGRDNTLIKDIRKSNLFLRSEERRVGK